MKKLIILAIGIGLVIISQRNSFSLLGSEISSGVGARALGMGGTFVAVAAGIDSCYWNPAGLGNMKESEITIMRTMNNRDVTNYQEWLAAGTKLGNYGGVGINYVRVKDRFMWFKNNSSDIVPYGFDDEWVGLAVGGNGTGYFKNMALGVNLKKRSSSLLEFGTFTNFGWSKGTPTGRSAEFMEYDVGILYHINKECSLGLMIQNFNEATIDYGSPTAKFPFARRIIKAGVSWRPDEKSIFAIDLYDWTMDDVYNQKIDIGQSKVRIGFERWCTDKIAVRAGLLSKYYHTIGFGVREVELKKLFPDVAFDIDYALLEGSGVGTHFLSCTAKF